ncbi:DUF6261 family protein [Bergeyella zoohelcum]|uniref:Uncharacterized protein n=1 Tax=Bergeyella zoohelcum TaxID=1015 RepID=A0A7Z8YNU0_9FLAO|nr:DUF6261 family protein [Bergeyella zoohelcum]VDH03701.1 Uncharacterised protein [Bergeyella zoohelcum]
MKISLSKLKTTTLSALAERIVVASKSGKYTLSVSQHPLLNALEMEKNNYKLLLNKQVYSGKGQKVAELDEARDKSYNAMKIYLKSYIGMPTLPNYEDAVALYDVFKQNNLNLDKKSYADQSVLLDKLIADLDKTENKERLTRLNLAAAFADLKTKQETFSHLISEQTEANAELRLTKSASAVRKDLESVIRNYLGFITAMKSQPDWSALYTEMSEIVKEIRNS